MTEGIILNEINRKAKYRKERKAMCEPNLIGLDRKHIKQN